MDKNASREYLKNLTAAQRKSLAEDVGVSHEYLYMIGSGLRTPSRRIAAKLQAATRRKVKAVDFDAEQETVACAD